MGTIIATSYLMGRKLMGRKVRTTMEIGEGKETGRIGRIVGVGDDLGIYFLIAPDDGSNIFSAMATACALIDG